MKTKILFFLAGLSLIGFNLSAQVIKVDKGIGKYEAQSGISGNLNSVGSDTLNNMMTLWSEEFGKIYSSVNVQIEGKGSGTAPPALIAGVSQLGPMSRKMKNEEIEKFEKKFGFKPLSVPVALDALSIFVHKDNPLNEISLPEADAVFSSTRKYGYKKAINVWGDLGLKDNWEKLPISLYGRNSASGTYGYFKSVALKKGDYRNTVKEQPGSASVVLGITENKNAIGYSGIGYVTSGVKSLAIAKKLGGKAYAPTYENVLNKKYPLSRFLYIYVVKAPNKPVDKLTAEFLKFVLSKKGQEIVVKDGYLPLPAKLVNKSVKLLK